jgi:eukaryotic-like serine/threonine-protein kinase
MGEENADGSEKLPPLAPLDAEQIAGTWFGRTNVSIARDASLRDATATTERPPPPTLPVRFTFVRELGRGGMGKVDEVFDSVLGRSVAQKSVLARDTVLPTTLLVSEAQTCAQLEHPSIVPIYDFGANVDGFPQYTMRLVRGRTLRAVLDDGDAQGLFATVAQRLGVLRQVCLAVAYAHGRGVVHRDLKPDNVICGEFGEVYVLDWGIAQLLDGSDIRRARHEDVQAGSPGYMAPEQVLRERISPATDVFALGAMLYEIVSGERAFEDRDLPSVLRRCSGGLDAPPSTRNSRIPHSFDALISKCLARTPDERPTAMSVAQAIDAFLDGERVRREREGEAERFADEGEEARKDFETRTQDARGLRRSAEDALEAIPLWESIDRKKGAWDLAGRAGELERQAADDLGRAQAAFVRALGRIPNHGRARRGLASLHYRLFELAEQDADSENMAQHLHLARGYDDGDLALELANEGVLIVEPDVPVRLSLARYDGTGLRFSEGEARSIEPRARCLVEAGSYVIRALSDDGATLARYPVLVKRAHVHRIKLRLQRARELPSDLVFIPGGPFLAANAKATRFEERTCGDFAIARFPVTFREYVRFLEDHAARASTLGDFLARDEHGEWAIVKGALEGGARERVPRERELDLPAIFVSWFDALAFTRWKAEKSGLPLRLPLELEWEKALRGADGRRFSMGNHLDPAFAKLRESRVEAAQPEPIGCFPLDESPYLVRDLTDGVGDFTGSIVDGRSAPTLEEEGRESVEGVRAVWRGGCWGTTALFPHAMRYTDPVMARQGWIGFRLALSLDQEGSSELSVEPMRRR